MKRFKFISGSYINYDLNRIFNAVNIARIIYQRSFIFDSQLSALNPKRDQSLQGNQNITIN